MCIPYICGTYFAVYIYLAGRECDTSLWLSWQQRLETCSEWLKEINVSFTFVLMLCRNTLQWDSMWLNLFV